MRSEEPRKLADVPARTDVAVIGAGITGLSAALALRKRGASVVVLESETAGFGASSRNGGMVLTGLKLGPGALIRRYGEARARAMFDASLRALDLVESLVAQERIDCSFERCGHLEVASKPGHVAGFESEARLLRERFDHRVAVLSREELPAEIGSGAFFGGVLDERSAGIDPARYVRGLAEATTRAGATLCERSPVGRIVRTDDGWQLVTSRGEVRAKNVLIATGAYTGAPFPQIRRRIVPLGSYVVASKPLAPEAAVALIPRNRMIYDSLRLLHYFRLTPDRRLLFGGRAAFMPEGPNTVEQSEAILRRDAIAIFPQLRDVEFEYAWGGTLDVTFDEMPHVSTVGGMYYAIGYVGHGVALATLLGTLVAGAILGDATSIEFASAAPTLPGYGGTPWFLPLVGAWTRMLDALG